MFFFIFKVFLQQCGKKKKHNMGFLPLRRHLLQLGVCGHSSRLLQLATLGKQQQTVNWFIPTERKLVVIVRPAAYIAATGGSQRHSLVMTLFTRDMSRGDS